MEVQPVFVSRPFQYKLPKDRGFAGCTGGGPVERRIGLYKSHVPAIDEGWTHWILEHGHPFYLRLKYAEIEDQEVRASGLANKYDAIIVPDQPRAATLNGRGNGALRKIGAQQECVLRKSFLRRGEFLDQVLYAIVDSDWRAARGTAATLNVH